jgi:hypothetical protein
MFYFMLAIAVLFECGKSRAFQNWSTFTEHMIVGTSNCRIVEYRVPLAPTLEMIVPQEKKSNP